MTSADCHLVLFGFFSLSLSCISPKQTIVQKLRLGFIEHLYPRIPPLFSPTPSLAFRRTIRDRSKIHEEEEEKKKSRDTSFRFVLLACALAASALHPRQTRRALSGPPRDECALSAAHIGGPALLRPVSTIEGNAGRGLEHKRCSELASLPVLCRVGLANSCQTPCFGPGLCIGRRIPSPNGRRHREWLSLKGEPPFAINLLFIFFIPLGTNAMQTGKQA